MPDLKMDNLPESLRRQVEQAADILRGGGVVAYPTDTVYGLGADAYHDEAVRKVYAVKQRPPGLPLPVLLADAGQLHRISMSSPLAERLIERFWPGGLTVVLWAQPHVPEIVTAGTGTVALRLPEGLAGLLTKFRLRKTLAYRDR